MTRSICLVYPILPPSENHIREVRWGKVHQPGRGLVSKPLGMCYTAEADGYRKKLHEYARGNWFVDIQKFRRGHQPWSVYSATAVLHFPADQILNSGWLRGPRGGKRKAKTPYKKMDVGNRRKLLEDCIAELLDIDDSVSFRLELVKVVARDRPKIEFLLEEENPVAFGIPEEYLK